MSLINDALKQARETQEQNPPPPPPLEFKSAESGQHENSRPLLLMFGMALVGLGIIALTVLLVWVIANKKDPGFHAQARMADPPLQTQTNTEAKPATNSATAATPTTPVFENPEEPDTNGVPVVAVVESPKPPELKLQGIYFNLTSPSAVLNGKTLYLGGRVNGFRIMAISVNSVTLVSATETNVLSLSE